MTTRGEWVRPFIALVIALLFWSPTAFADCAALAKWGIYDYRSTTTDDQQTSSFASWFCSIDTGSAQSTRQASANLGFPIGDLPVKLGWDGKDSSWNTWKRAFCSSVATNQQQRTVVSQFVQSINPGVISAINDCQKFPGVHAWLTQGADAAKFTINISFTSFSTINSATVRDVLISPASVQRTCSPAVPLDSAHQRISNAQALTVLCERPVKDSVLVAINADQPLTIDSPLTLSEIASTPPPPKSPPVRLERFCATGEVAGHAKGAVTVGKNYKIIGGGAQVNWSGNGNFLIASYPEGQTTWRALSKDHSGSGQGGPDPASITSCAIALYDPDDEWDVQVFTSYVGAAAPSNVAVATVPDSYVMTGGGAMVPDDPIGQLLYASHPNNANSWMARSHDKYVTSKLPITAYAIGIKPRNGAPLPEVKTVPGLGNQASQSSGAVPLDVGWLMTGGGAFADFNGDGNFLTASYPIESAWYAKSSDQGKADAISVKIYLIEIRTFGMTTR